MSCCHPDRRASAASDVGSIRSSSGPTPELVTLPGGVFAMGSDDPWAYAEDGEGPVRAVHIDPFAIGVTAVTVAQFAEFVEHTEYRTDAETWGTHWYSSMRWGIPHTDSRESR